MQYLNDLLEQVNKAPLSLLVILALNALGLALKMLRWFPNGAIPLTLIVTGAVVMYFCGSTSAVNPDLPNPQPRLAMIGVIFGFGAWILHGTLWKRLESKLPAPPSQHDSP